MSKYDVDGDFKTLPAAIGYRGSLIKMALPRIPNTPPFDTVVAYVTSVADAAEHYAFHPTDVARYLEPLAEASAHLATLHRYNFVPEMLPSDVSDIYSIAHLAVSFIQYENANEAFSLGPYKADRVPGLNEDELAKAEAYWRFFDVVGKRAPKIVQDHPEVADAFSALWFAGAKEEAVNYARAAMKKR